MKNCSHCGTAITGTGYKYCDDCRDTSAPWRPSIDNIALAAQHLGIAVPVEVRRSATRKLLGRYHGIRLHDDAPRDPDVIATMSDDYLNTLMHHHITVSARLTPEAASRVIWHEMTHAAQYERDPDYYVSQYAAELRDAKRLAALTGQPFDRFYRMISFEIEAKANEGNHYKLYPLSLANNRANMPALKRPHSRIHRVVNGKIIDGTHADTFEKNALKNISTAKTMLSV
jgi:hypothetical protein